MGVNLVPIAGVLDRLRNTPPFSHLPAALMAQVLTAARVQALAAGETLIDPSRDCGDFLAVLDGELEVCWTAPGAAHADGMRVQRLAQEAGSDGVAILYGVPHRLRVRAVHASRVLRIDGEHLDELLAWSQRFAAELRELADLRARMSLVRNAAPFRRLPLEHMRQAFESLRPVDIERPATIVRQGEPGDRYYLIERGTAEVWRTDPMTDETARVAVLGPGDAFGEEALLVGGFRNATVKMVTQGRLWVLPKPDFDRLLKPALVEEIDAERARTLTRDGVARWLDCRYDIEFAECRIRGAHLAPLDRIREHAVALDPSAPYIVYCRSGRRSACAAYLLRERGFRAYSLAGGLRDWPYELEAS